MTIHRIGRIFKLDRHAFTEFDQDSDAFEEAIAVVFLVAFSSEVMGIIEASLKSLDTELFVAGIVFPMLWVFAAWFLWSTFIFVIGACFFDSKVSLKQVLQWIGFAQAPLMLQVIPFCGAIIGNVWALAAAFIAIRNGMQLSILKTLIIVIVGWIAIWLWNMVLMYVLGMSALVSVRSTA